MIFSKTSKTFCFIFSFLLTNMSAIAMQRTDDRPITSICLKAELPLSSQTNLYEGVAQGLNKVTEIKTSSAFDGHLHINKPDTYHLSVATLEAANANIPLVKKDSNLVWTQMGKAFTAKIDTYNTHSHVYGIYLFAHGYDATGAKVTKHYSAANVTSQNINKHFDTKKGIRLTHFHIVARHGTSFKGGPKGEFAKDCESKVNALITSSSSKFKDANFETSKGTYSGHITLAVMKKNPGLVTSQSESFAPENFTHIFQMHQAVENEFQKSTAQSNGELKISLSRFSTNSK